MVSTSIKAKALYPKTPCNVNGIFLEPIIIKVVDEISQATPKVIKRMMLHDTKDLRCSIITPTE
jgi:hypothetical protein